MGKDRRKIRAKKSKPIPQKPKPKPKLYPPITAATSAAYPRSLGGATYAPIVYSTRNGVIDFQINHVLASSAGFNFPPAAASYLRG